MTGGTKVNNFDSAISIDHNVFRLQVTMGIAFTMDVPSPFNKLFKDKLTELLVERRVYVHQLSETRAFYKLLDYDSCFPMRYYSFLNEFYYLHDITVL